MRSIGKTGIYLSLLLVVALICTISCSADSSKYAASVNGTKIETITLDTAMNNFIENQKSLGVDVQEEDKDKLRKAILEELISAELLYQESKKAKLEDLSKDVDGQFKKIKEGFGSEEEFNNVLKDKGISAKSLKDDIKKGVYITTFLNRNVYKDTNITEEEKRKEYENNKGKLNVPEQIRASHILLRVAKDANPEDKDSARKKIEEIRQRALAGEDFAELAKANSEDTSASNGGDLGYFGRNNMVKSFEDAAFGLNNIGDISEVVETQFGYHIIRLSDKKPARMLEYSEVEKDIGNFLIDKHKREKLDKFVDGLREKAKIKVY